jgi:hypothetical protein
VADNWYAGNAAVDGDPYRGWLLGHFIDPNDGMRKTEALEIKWGVHPAGQQRADWNTDEPRTTLLLMIRGKVSARLVRWNRLARTRGRLRPLGTRNRPFLAGRRRLGGCHNPVAVTRLINVPASRTCSVTSSHRVTVR